MKLIAHAGACAVALGVLMGCSGDETVYAKGAGARVWSLDQINGAQAASDLSIMFGTRGRVTGQGLCHDFAGKQTAPYPWFALESLTSTASRCDSDLQSGPIISALMRMNVSEVSGNLMILSNEVGEEMVFTAAPAADG